MEEDQKKKVMVAVIIVSLAAAAGLALMQFGSDDVEIPEFEGQIIWLLCRNPDCGHTYTMPKHQYFVYLQENDDPRSLGAPALICQKCGKPSVYRAEKCEKCGEVFEPGSIFQVHGDVDDYPDRCPKCKYSRQEEKRGIKYEPKR